MRRRLIFLFAALALVLAACGGGAHHKVVPKPAVSQAVSHTPTHPCSPSNYYMQCAAGAPGQVSSGFLLNPFTRFGIDFAYGGPSGSVVALHGAAFAASYLSDSSKDWTGGLLRSYARAGRAAVFVWETSAARSLDGWSAGYNDAWRAAGEAKRLGYPHAHIDFASDYDTSVYGTRFVSYYQGARRYLGFARTGAYGGLHTVVTLCARHVTSANWQTLAWSYGVWASASCAPLRQTSISDRWYGYSVDYDLAVAPYYGQVGVAVASPDRYAVFPKTRFRFAHGVVASEYYTVKAWDHLRCRNPVKRKSCKATHFHLVLLRDRDWFVAHHTANLRRVARTPRWGKYHLGVRFHALSVRLAAR